MSRPRKPFGTSHPGRVPSTMMKVLAAEMSDPGRLRRGKQYAKDGSVLDIVIEPGLVTCEIQGSRSTPYIASIEVTFGDGMPLRRDLHVTCTCPDDDNWDGHACKHALAAMFTLADELLIEPELLDRWRGHDDPSLGAPDAPGDADDDADDEAGSTADTAADEFPAPDSQAEGRRRRHLRLVHGIETGRAERDRARAERREPDELVDPLADVLAIPAGAPLPEIPLLDPIEPRLPRRTELAEVLAETHRELRIDWD